MRQLLQIIGFCVFATQAAFAQIVFSSVEQKNVTSTAFDLAWTTGSTSGTPTVKYGLTTSYELGTLTSATSGTSHTMSLTGLSPATFYYARVGITTTNGTYWGSPTYYSTASTSSGDIRIFFNKSIDATYSLNGANPEIINNATAIENELIAYIDGAQSTIDACIYNNNRTGIVTALKNAHNRGVRVRYIASTTTANAALTPAPPFSVGYVNNTGLMHNKFMVVDAESAADAVVWTGSMNWTDTNIFDDYNNVVVVHDQALARCYVKEFEEMWGGTGNTFNSSASKVGSQKTDNTPHRFYVNGTWIESYFSPSDNATNGIKKALQTAASSIHFLTYSFTNNDLGTTLATEFNAGVTVKGVIANEDDLGCELTSNSNLQTLGVAIPDDNLNGELHHKYAIIDVNYPLSDPMVVTGSHNWSDGAEDVNDENTLIIHNADVANMFIQEFAKRWCEVKSNSNCALSFPAPVGVQNVENIEGASLSVFPNPTQGDLRYEVSAEKTTDFEILLYNAIGERIETQYLSNVQGVSAGSISLHHQPAGMYFVVLHANGQAMARRVVKE